MMTDNYRSKNQNRVEEYRILRFTLEDSKAVGREEYCHFNMHSTILHKQQAKKSSRIFSRD